MGTRTYSELVKLKTFEERFNYLKLGGRVGAETFGFDRFINQILYRSSRWREVRNKIIVRDNGCDLGCEDEPIGKIIIVHHMNPISVEDIQQMKEAIFNPEYLISTSSPTHNAIHYGDNSVVIREIKERFKDDTCPWKIRR